MSRFRYQVNPGDILHTDQWEALLDSYGAKTPNEAAIVVGRLTAFRGGGVTERHTLDVWIADGKAASHPNGAPFVAHRFVLVLEPKREPEPPAPEEPAASRLARHEAIFGGT